SRGSVRPPGAGGAGWSPGGSETARTSRSGGSTSRNSPCQSILRRPGSANIVSRHEPPGRTSIDTVSSGISDSAPPNQSAKRSGSVHSCQTRSRGAAKTRVIAILASVTTQPPVEVVEAVLPQGFEPVRRAFERTAAQPRRPQLRVAQPLDD